MVVRACVLVGRRVCGGSRRKAGRRLDWMAVRARFLVGRRVCVEAGRRKARGWLDRLVVRSLVS